MLLISLCYQEKPTTLGFLIKIQKKKKNEACVNKYSYLKIRVVYIANINSGHTIFETL